MSRYENLIGRSTCRELKTFLLTSRPRLASLSLIHQLGEDLQSPRQWSHISLTYRIIFHFALFTFQIISLPFILPYSQNNNKRKGQLKCYNATKALFLYIYTRFLEDLLAEYKAVLVALVSQRLGQLWRAAVEDSHLTLALVLDL